MSLLTQTLCKVREDEEQVLLVAPYWLTQTWFPELILLTTAPPWRIPLRKDLLSQGLGTIWHWRPDLWNLHLWLLDGTWQIWGVETITQNRAPLTRQAYALKWSLFVNWCSSCRENQQRCTIGVVLSSCKKGWSIGCHPPPWKCMWLLSRPIPMQWMAGPWESMISSWGSWWVPVQAGLQRGPFELLDSAELKFLSAKTALLTALTSISRGSGTSKHFRWAKSALCSGRPTLTLSWDPSLDTCLRFPPRPFRDQLVNLQAMPSEEADPAFALLCPIRALRIYVDHTRSFRSSEQLFVCHGGQQKCKTVSKQRLAYWMPSPWCTNLKASHAPWGDGSLHWSVASSYALVHGASLADICRAMGGATLNTFAGFYSLCVVSVSSHVLGKR